MTEAPALDTSADELRFAAGLPGFPDAHRFALVSFGDDTPFAVLRSLDDPALEFVVAPPTPFFPDYEPELGDDDAGALDLASADDALVLLVVNLTDGVDAATANLLGPVVVNRHSRQAAQVILPPGSHELRAPLFGPSRSH